MDRDAGILWLLYLTGDFFNLMLIPYIAVALQVSLGTSVNRSAAALANVCSKYDQVRYKAEGLIEHNVADSKVQMPKHNESP